MIGAGKAPENQRKKKMEKEAKAKTKTGEGPLRTKSKAFAVKIVRLVQVLAGERKEFVLSRQLLKSGTSIGANLHEAAGAQSTSDFIAKLSIALKEAYETRYWLELLRDTGYIARSDHDLLRGEVDALLSMLNKSILTNKAKLAAASSKTNSPPTD